MTSGTKTRACLIAAGAIALSALPAAADGPFSYYPIYEIKGGVLAHDVPDLWSGFQVEKSSADINLEVMFSPALPVLGGAIRPALGGTINTAGQTSHGYLDARWQYDTPFGFYFGVGLGAAIHDGAIGPDGGLDRKWLGSRVLFHIPVEVGYRFDQHNSLSVYFEHTSNAYTATYNEGLDRIGVRYGWRF
jgi:lipid A 3-O-deacylase